jgi:hypothetical protein
LCIKGHFASHENDTVVILAPPHFQAHLKGNEAQSVHVGACEFNNLRMYMRDGQLTTFRLRRSQFVKSSRIAEANLCLRFSVRDGDRVLSKPVVTNAFRCCWFIWGIWWWCFWWRSPRQR